QSEKFTSPSMASRCRPSTRSNSAADAEKASVGSANDDASFLKPTPPNPFTRASASQGAYGSRSGTVDEYPFAKDTDGSTIFVQVLSNWRADRWFMRGQGDEKDKAIYRRRPEESVKADRLARLKSWQSFCFYASFLQRGNLSQSAHRDRQP